MADTEGQDQKNGEKTVRNQKEKEGKTFRGYSAIIVSDQSER